MTGSSLFSPPTKDFGGVPSTIFSAAVGTFLLSLPSKNTRHIDLYQAVWILMLAMGWTKMDLVWGALSNHMVPFVHLQLAVASETVSIIALSTAAAVK